MATFLKMTQLPHRFTFTGQLPHCSQAPLMNRVMEETEAVHRFDDGTRNRRVAPWNEGWREREEEKKRRLILTTAQRKVATGSIPIRLQTKAFLLLLSKATMSGRMWSVFFSLKSWMGKDAAAEH
ncbi:hypothetical protein EYF80_061084 [Liparis tanakae]|uniref:Uncharacterized protein n=1 Tax=Liparis tanakae TaxID=230148 RepID=A0A4Z2EIJ2_9TELE|nr:hypothetical protein EYF80_061084 [Liparis tanakae]